MESLSPYSKLLQKNWLHPFHKFRRSKKPKKLSLIFDDSCGEIYNDREFLNIVTSVRHRVVQVIYVKPNLFQQSRISRTLDLNTPQIIMFKPPRDISSQLEFLEKQLKKSVFLKSTHEKATAETFGHLLFDLDPKTMRTCVMRKTGVHCSKFKLLTEQNSGNS